MRKKFGPERGFTLVEILIVIIVLGILAMIIVPQLSVSTTDAKISTLKTNLAGIRSAIEIYYAQHNMKYPGQTKAADGSENADALEAETSMVQQLVQYSDAKGKVSGIKDSTYLYGPYIKGPSLPPNPFLSGPAATGVDCDTTADITTARTADDSTGWKYHFNTGVFYANNTGTAPDGTSYKDY